MLWVILIMRILISAQPSLATFDVVGHGKEDVGGGRVVKVEYVLKARTIVWVVVR